MTGVIFSLVYKKGKFAKKLLRNYFANFVALPAFIPDFRKLNINAFKPI
jgi:hypothetical protein